MTVEAASMTLYGTKIAAASASATVSGASSGAIFTASAGAAVPTVLGLIVSGVIFSA